MSDVIDNFDDNSRPGEKRWFLSNFFPVSIEFHGTMWATAEHAYQAAKTVDLRWKEEVQQQISPRAAKKRGRIVDLRPDWEDVKDEMMYKIVLAKFKQHSDLAAMLLSTGRTELIEGNTWHDNYWGDCRCGSDRCSHTKGLNKLGTILMAVREVLRG